MTTTDTRPDPVPLDVDWPRLVGICERVGVPVSRVDAEGGTHILRTVDDLEEWE